MSEKPLAAWLAEAAAPQRRSEEEPERDARDAEPAEHRFPSTTPPSDAGPSRRLRRLAALPWLVAGLLVLLALSRWTLALPDRPAITDDEAAASVQPVEPGAAPSGPPVEGAPSPEPVDGEPSPESVAGDGAPDSGAAAEHADPTGHARISAAAVVAVRLALTGTDQEGDRYVDLVSPDGLRWHDDVAVVTASVVLLEGADGVWDRTRTGRYAIAMKPGPDGIDPVGPPWPVPGAPSAPPPTADPPEPVGDEDLAAALRAALERAGYADVALVGLLPAPGPSVLRLRARGDAPGDATPRDHDLLLDASPPHDVLGTTGGDPP